MRVLATRDDILRQYQINRPNEVEAYFKALDLKEKFGFGARRISRLLNAKVPEGTINYWLMKLTTPIGAKGILELERAGLLPLEVSNSKAFMQLIRVLGLRYGDGCIYRQERNRSITFYVCFGKKEDAITLCKDVKESWGMALKPHWGTNAYYVYLPASLARLIIHLGSPVGDKTLQAFRLPKWIFNLPEKLRWEFLDGLYSCDGATPRLQKSGHCLCSLKLCLSAEKKIVEEFKAGFMNDLWKLISSLGIQASKPKVEYAQPRIAKDGTITYPVTIRILTRKANMIKFLSNVSYQYRKSAFSKIKEIIGSLK